MPLVHRRPPTRCGRPRGHRHGARRTLGTLTAAALTASVAALAFGAVPASAANRVGPGYGLDAGGHNDGAYSISTSDHGQVLGFCVTPGGTGPEDIPGAVYHALAGAPDGALAELGYLASVGQGGLAGYAQRDVDAAVALIAYRSAGGRPPAGDPQPPGPLLASLADDMVAYPGPWTLTATPASGGTYRSGATYVGSLTLTAANGDPVPGVAIVPPATGAGGQWSNFTWTGAGTTDAEGQVAFSFNQSAPGPFLEGFSLVGGAPGAAPVEYAAPAGSGGQSMLAALGVGGPTALLNGTVTPAAASVEVQKADDDPAYVPVPAGVTYAVVNRTGADPSVPIGSTITTLTTTAGGRAGPSAALLPAGGYSVVETGVPAGSGLSVDANPVPFSVSAADAGEGAAVSVAVTDTVLPGAMTVTKVDRDTGAGLTGAAFRVSFDPEHNGTFSQQVSGPGTGGAFVSGVDGRVSDPEGVLTRLLPGDYQVTETGPPAGHVLAPQASQTVHVSPGTSGSPVAVTFADSVLPVITTVAASGGPLGTGLGDVALFTGSAHAGGTITFDAYGPVLGGAPTCTPATLAYTSGPVPVAGSGRYPMGVSFTPGVPGTYDWIERYSGDVDNQPVSGSCGAPGESSTITPLPAAAPPATSPAASVVPAAVPAPIVAEVTAVTG